MNKSIIYKKITDNLYSFVENMCAFFIVVQVIVVSLVVFGRFILNKTPAWGEEIALICMTWLSFLSASMAIKKDAHIRMSIIDNLLGESICMARDRIFNVLNIVFSVFILYDGVKLVKMVARSIMPGTGLSTGWLYLSIPVSAFFYIIMLISKVGEFD